MNVYGTLLSIKARRDPPHLLGGAARYFPFSAATPRPLDATPHISGLSVRVTLDSTHHLERPFRTSELVEGKVHIYSPNTDASSRPLSLSLRVYFESRTLFWTLELDSSKIKVKQQLNQLKSQGAQNYKDVMRHKVHRGVVSANATTLSWSSGSKLSVDFQSSESVSGMLEATLPFSFTVPRRMNITEYNKLTHGPQDLRKIERCPPPTFRDCRDGSVQWVVEVTLALQPVSEEEVEDDAMFKQSTDNRIVTRLVFPVLPSPQDVRALRNEPYFGRDISMDSLGCRRLSQEEHESGKKATLTRVRARGGEWEAYVKDMRLDSEIFVSSELYVPSGARIAIDALSLPLVLFLKVDSSKSKSKSLSSFLRSPKPKVAHVQRALVHLSKVVSTRGGKEIQPHKVKTLVRQYDQCLGEHSASTSTDRPGLLVPSDETADALELDLTFDLQSEAEMELPTGKQTPTPGKYLTPSFRTPNIQLEYLLTVSLWFSGDEIERFVARFPVQLVPGGESELPLFEDVVNHTGDQPPAFSDAPPQY